LAWDTFLTEFIVVVVEVEIEVGIVDEMGIVAVGV
jgi:hypothetical protein